MKCCIIILLCVTASYAVPIDLSDSVVSTNAYMNSDTIDVGEFKRLVDGDKGTKFDTKCIAAQNVGGFAWWQLDLLNEISVYNLKLLTRGDKLGPSQFADFKIFVSKRNDAGEATLCATQKGEGKKGKFVKYPCGKALRGRYITIMSTAEFLTLCEIRMNGKIVDSLDTHIDLSGGSVRTGSSFKNYDVGRIIDSDTSQFFPDDCAAAEPKENAEVSWFEIDMGVDTNVGSVEILARHDKDALQHLTNIEIYVSRLNEISADNFCAQAGNSASMMEFNIYHCAKPLRGRYVTIRKLKAVGDDIYLSICEVRVNEKESKNKDDAQIDLTDAVIATGDYMNKETLNVGEFKRLVDGNTNNMNFDNFCMAAQNDGVNGSWWQIDLLKQYKVSSVDILGRGDMNNQLSNFEIYLSKESNMKPSKMCARQDGNAANTGFVKYPCQMTMRTRYITIVARGDGELPLAICELRVYGAIIPKFDTFVDLTGAKATAGQSFEEYGVGRITNTDTSQFFDTACAAAEPAGDSMEAYFEIDMIDATQVGSVEILARRDMMGAQQLQNFEIYVARRDEIDPSNMCTMVGGGASMNQFNIYPCDQQMSGRYITIIKRNTSDMDMYLSICEVRVNKEGVKRAPPEQPQFDESDQPQEGESCVRKNECPAE